LDVFRNAVGENHYAYVANINNLGGVYIAIKNWSKAIEYFQIALDIDKKIHGENSANYASALNNLGIAYNNFGLYDEAVKYCSEALDIRKRLLGVENKDYANSLSTMGAIYSTVKDYNSADSCYNQSISIIKKIYGTNHSVYGYALASLGGFYLKSGDYKKSEKYLTESFMVNKRILGEGYPGYNESLGDLANLRQAIGDFKSAIKLYSEIYDHSVNLIARDFQWMSEKEKENYWQEKSILLERITFFSANFYMKNQSLTELTYNVNLVSNSLLMQTSSDLNKAITKSKDSSLIKVYNDLKSLRKYNAKLTSEGSRNIELIFKLENQADSLDQLLSRKMSAYTDYKKNFSLTWKDVQANLSSDEAAIEFARYYDDKDSAYHYLALIVKQGEKYPSLVKLCSEGELKRFSPEKELNELYSLLWKPISSQFTGIKTIYYTPAGLMNNIPFQALNEDKTEGREYLMDKYSLNQLTSTRYLALGLKKRAEEPIETNIALFGGVNYNDLPDSKSDTSNYLSFEAAFLYKNAITNRDIEDTRSGASYLPGTKKEVENIGDLLKSNKWNVNVIEGKNASEDKVKNLVGKNSKSIMHIATHGFAFPDKENNKKRTEIGIETGNERYKVAENPMIRSGLLFSGSNMTWQGKGDSLLKITNEDGVLTAYELSQLSLDNTKLVVLSACETGKGAIQGSEGTFGLKRALKLAGVDNMIVSLWKVPDDATMEMMTLFYTELAKTKLPVPAFELAQKAMRNKYPNEPKKWAGFVFVR
jgi:CHAT domain-containing protein